MNVTVDEITWLQEYLQTPDSHIELRCRKTGRMIAADFSDGASIEPQPEYSTNYAMGGDELELFWMLTDAAARNPMLAILITNAFLFLTEHVPQCRECGHYHQAAKECHTMGDKQPNQFNFEP